MGKIDRRMFRMADRLERRVGPLLVPAVNQVLPRLMRVGAGGGHRYHAHVPYAESDRGTLYLDIAEPLGPGPHPVLLGFHGGAWVIGRKENLRHIAAAFARRGFLVLLPQYRLASQQPFPACVDDVGQALAWARDHAAEFGGDPEAIGVFGDSAGGHLSAYAAVALADSPHGPDNLPKIAAAVHWYGVFDFAQFARVPWHRTPQIMRLLFGERSEDAEIHAEASPRAYLNHVEHIPPTLLMVGTRDPLFRQSTSYAKDLEAMGATSRLQVYEGSVHGFMNLWWQRDARHSTRLAADWFADHLAATVPAATATLGA